MSPKKNILFSFLISLSSMVFAGTIQVANPGNGNDIQPNIQAAVNSAVNGDVIVLPAGQFVVNKNVVISKFISIKGQGRTNTILYRSESVSDATLQSPSWVVIFSFNINSNASSKIVLSDICFKSKKPSMNSIVDHIGNDSIALDGLSLARDRGVEFIKCVDFVVTGCRFENFGNGAVAIQHDDSIVSGLIYKNEFVHNAKGSAALGLGYGVVVYGTNTQWLVNPRFGTSNFIFVEDNYFDYHRHSIAAGGCALYVFRHNYVSNNVAGNTSHAIDAHEARLISGVNYYSTRAIEVYNDSVVNTQFKDGSGRIANGTLIKSVPKPGTTEITWLTECAIKTRGGEAMVHDNYIEGYRFGVSLVANNILTNPYPIPYQQGYLSALKFGASHTGIGQGKEAGDNFFWNDKFIQYASGNSANTYFYNYSPGYLVNDRDYHLSSNPSYTTYTYPHPLRVLKSSNGSAISVTTTQTNVSCSGGSNGSVTVSPSGGTSPYTYSWNTSPVKTTSSVTGLVAGAYAVVISDASGSKITVNVTITQPSVLSASISSSSNIKCNGGNSGSATVSVNGGTTPYTYSWNTSPVQTTATVNNLTVGTYTVSLIDALGCSKSVNVTITQPSVLSASISGSSNVKCNGANTGSATVSVSGGTSPYTYSWNTSPVQTSATASNLTAGTYTASITDASGCNKTVSVVITQPSALSISISGSSNVKCNGGNTGSATVSVSGGTLPYTYSWNTSPVQTTATASNLTAGSYTESVTDGAGCSKLLSITISQPSALSASIGSSSNVNCKGSNTGSATVTASGGTAPYIYSWNTSPVQTTAAASNLSIGTYTASVTDALGCSNAVNTTITQSVLSASISSSSNVKCNGGNSGSATVSVNGGTTPYTYSWNTSPVQTTATVNNLTVGTYTVSVIDALGCSKSVNVTITQPSVLSASISSSSNVKCNGANTGSATVSVSGGTSPYMYSWNTSPVQTSATASNLIAGTYTVVLTDASGCSKTASVTISQPSLLTASINSYVNVKCNGGNAGSAFVSAGGGTPPYTYSWNSSPVQTTATASNLLARTYTVGVSDASGCNKMATVTISQPLALTATVSSLNNVKCNGGNSGLATVSVSGGTAPYTYSWSTSPVQTSATASNLSVGTYTVSITDSSGCGKIVNVTITQPLALSANIGSSSNVKCNGGNSGTATVIVNGGTAPYTYLWNTTPIQTSATASNLSVGTYTATITDASGCNKIVTAAITQPTVLLVSIGSSNNVKCFGGNTGSATVIASGGTAPCTYFWNTSPVQTSATAGNLTAGTYTATITDASGCNKTVNVTITQPSALAAAISSSSNVKCFGGNNGYAVVSANGGATPYTYSWNTTSVQTTTTASDLLAGTYTVSISDALGCNKMASVTISQPSALTASVSSINNIKCNGGNTGSATISLSGGTAPYIYSWSTSPVQTSATANNLSVGTYTVSMNDASGCNKTVNVTISQPSSALTSSVSSLINVKCFAEKTGSALVSASGGTLPYSYSWNTTPVQTTATALNLAAGTYIVTVTDSSGCNKAVNIAITQPSELLASISNSANLICFGDSTGSATVNVVGDSASFTYSWNTYPIQTLATATKLTSGIYIATVTDSLGCAKTLNTKITQSSTLFVSIDSIRMVSCNGRNDGLVILKTSGGSVPYIYSWNTNPIQTTANIGNMPSGAYAVLVTDSVGCTQSTNATITQPSELLLSLLDTLNINCYGKTGEATVNVNGGSPPYSYLWNTLPAQTISTAGALFSGTYIVNVTDSAGCFKLDSIIVKEPSEIKLDISATIENCGKQDGSISINVNGGVGPYTYLWNTGETTNNLTALKSEMYTVEVTDANLCVKTEIVPIITGCIWKMGLH